MARPGPKPDVTDLRLLFEIKIADDNRIFAKEISDNVPTGLQQTRDRLNKLVNNKGHLEMEKIGGRNLYWLTDAGEDWTINRLRELMS